MREPAVAGTFYPDNKMELESMLHSFFSNIKPVKFLSFGAISPHAGYIYSGQTAAISYASMDLEEIKNFVILGPNHTGLGESLSLSLEDWETPLGVIKNNKELGMKILENSKFLQHDELAHEREHSIEVQIPFIQYVKKNAKIVPIVMMDQSLEASFDLANALNKVLDDKTIVIASSDFSHYLTAEEARKKDEEAINEILKLDYETFQANILNRERSICGYGPITTLMIFSKLRGCKEAKLLHYTNSGEINGDYYRVVAYSSILFLR